MLITIPETQFYNAFYDVIDNRTLETLSQVIDINKAQDRQDFIYFIEVLRDLQIPNLDITIQTQHQTITTTIRVPYHIDHEDFSIDQILNIVGHVTNIGHHDSKQTYTVQVDEQIFNFVYEQTVSNQESIVEIL